VAGTCDSDHLTSPPPKGIPLMSNLVRDYCCVFHVVNRLSKVALDIIPELVPPRNAASEHQCLIATIRETRSELKDVFKELSTLQEALDASAGLILEPAGIVTEAQLLYNSTKQTPSTVWPKRRPTSSQLGCMFEISCFIISRQDKTSGHLSQLKW
jgi:hypothetical protein